MVGVFGWVGLTEPEDVGNPYNLYSVLRPIGHVVN